MFDGVGLDDHPGSDEYCRSSVVHPTQTIDSDGTAEEQFLARPRAHEQWTEEERQIFIEVCGPTMQALNYDIPVA